MLVGGGADEAPEVYKRLPDVLAAHGGTIRVKHRLRPLGVAMAGRDVHDPYKDWGPRERPSAVLGSCRRLIASTAVGAIELDSRRRARPKRRWLECRTSRGPGRGYEYGGPAFPGGILVGIGLGILLGDFFAWLLIGLGAGFILMGFIAALARR